jgi:hypothetical protein
MGDGSFSWANKKGEAGGFALWCCVLIRYFYCFKLDGVIWQVSAWRRNESTGADWSEKQIPLFRLGVTA